MYSSGALSITVAMFYSSGNWYFALLYLFSVPLISSNKFAGSYSFFMITAFNALRNSILDTISCGTYLFNNAYTTMCYSPLGHLVFLAWWTMPINDSLVKSAVRLDIAITFIFFDFSCFLHSIVVELATLSLPLGKSVSLVFWTLTTKPYTSAYAVRLGYLYACLWTWSSILTPFIYPCSYFQLISRPRDSPVLLQSIMGRPFSPWG